jgi:hypothetical protein
LPEGTRMAKTCHVSAARREVAIVQSKKAVTFMPPGPPVAGSVHRV